MEQNKKGLNTLAFCLGILLAGVLIQTAGWLKGDRLVFPDVGEILRTFVRMLGEERTWRQIGTTLVHLVESLAAAAVIGTALGTLAANVFRSLQYSIYIDKNMISHSIFIVIKRLLWIVCNIGISYLAFNQLITLDIHSWMSWLTAAAAVACVSTMVTALTGYAFFREDFHNMLELVRRITRRKKR